MKAAMLHETHQPLRIEELKMPDVGDEDVLIKVATCSVCHTNLKVVKKRNRFTPPTILEHEIARTIEQAKTRCQDFKVRNQMIIGMHYKYNRCRYCLTTRENLCEKHPTPPSLRKADNNKVTHQNVDDFAKYVSVPTYMAFRIPNRMSIKKASIVGCRVTTTYNAVKHHERLKPNDSALVIGCDSIDLNTIQFLRCFGAYPIITVNIVDDKLEAAKKFGATHTINASTTDPVQETRKLTNNNVDKAFETIGNPKTSDQIIQATRPDNTTTIINNLNNDPFTISNGRFVTSEITITNVSNQQAHDVKEVFQIATTSKIELKSLITKTYRYDEINETLKDLEHRKLRIGISLQNQQSENFSRRSSGSRRSNRYVSGSVQAVSNVPLVQGLYEWKIRDEH